MRSAAAATEAAGGLALGTISARAAAATEAAVSAKRTGLALTPLETLNRSQIAAGSAAAAEATVSTG
jgi:hypothetical protein